MTDDSIRSATNVLQASRAGIDAKLAQDQVVVAEKLRFLLRTVPELDSAAAEMLLDQFVSNRFGSGLPMELPTSSENQ